MSSSSGAEKGTGAPWSTTLARTGSRLLGKSEGSRMRRAGPRVCGFPGGGRDVSTALRYGFLRGEGGGARVARDGAVETAFNRSDRQGKGQGKGGLGARGRTLMALAYLVTAVKGREMSFLFYCFA